MAKSKKVEHLYVKYKDHIYNFIHRLANDPELAMDITHQVFLKALDQPNNILLTKAWFITNARNNFYQEIKRKVNISFDIIDESTELNFNNEQFRAIPISSAIKDLQQKIEKSINKMSIATKEIMILYFIENLLIIEISTITQRPIVDIKINLHHARVLFEINLIKEMKGKVIAANDHCHAYTRITNKYRQNDIVEPDLKIINLHISNCKHCINNDEQLKRTGILLNLTPLYNTPIILDEIIYDTLKRKEHSIKICSAMKTAKIIPFVITVMIVFIALKSFSDIVHFNALFII